MKIITICNHKGGSGKTTCAIHLAAALALVGSKVLAIDLDPQGFMTRMVGLNEPPEQKSALTLFGPNARFEKQHIEALENFDFIPASTGLTNAIKKLTRPTDVFWLKEVLGESKGYDYILIDSSSSVTVYTLNALVASQYVIIPVIPEYLPVIGAEQTFQTCSLVRSKLNPDLRMPLFLLTQVDGRKTIHQKYNQYLRQHYGEQVLQHVIRTNAALSEETLQGKTVFKAEPNSKGAIDFANVTDEMLSIMDGRKVLEATPEEVPSAWRPLVEL